MTFTGPDEEGPLGVEEFLLGIMLVYFDKERHLFEGFYVPGCVCRHWVGEEERDGDGKKKTGEVEKRGNSLS